MEFITKFLKSYLNKKIKFNTLNFLIKFLTLLLFYILTLVLLEKNAFLHPITKIKIFNTTYTLLIFTGIYILLKIIIHKNNLFNNSNLQEISKELINKIAIKDRIVNVLQIYSKLDNKNPYSDLTIKAIDDVESQLKTIDLKKIKFKILPNQLYLLLTVLISFSGLIIFSNEHHEALNRLVSKNIEFKKPLPFQLKLKQDESIIFKGESHNIDIIGTGELPKEINLFWIHNNNMYSRILEKIDNSYSYIFNNLNSELTIWAEYKNNAILPYNNYQINSDTIKLKLKNRPQIKDLNITIIPPKYTKMNKIIHQNTSFKINALKGSRIKFKGLANKQLKASHIIFEKDSIINMNISNNQVSYETEVFKSNNITIICYDQDNNNSIKMKYFINIINDMNPSIIINKPMSNIELDENYLIPIEGVLSDDFGVDKAILEYYIEKPYYLEQDTILNNSLIFEAKKNNTIEYFEYNWDISNLNIGPGDEINYWIKVYDNNIMTGPGITISNILKAYYPTLEELFLAVETEQENMFETFDDMNESMEELKNMYEDLSNDVLKEELGWEQEIESKEIINEIEEISNKIQSLEQTIEKIEELNEKNNLINDSLSEKIGILQKMFQDIITPDLMKALEELQKSLNEDDFQKALEELNNFEFEMEDLENQLDRMIDLFEQVVTEQKLDELIKKIENMKELQEEISNNNLNSKTDLMEEEQKNNLSDLFQTMENTEVLLEKNNKKTADSLNELRNSSTSKNLENQINQMLNNNNYKENISNEIKNNIELMEKKMNEIIDTYNKKFMIEILNMYTRIIKNLIDMSYEQELINIESKPIKYKTDKNVRAITTKENVMLYQYKNLFIQVSELSSKSFHIKPEVSKTFGKIFNNIINAIHNFEQGKISTAKDHQKLILEYINKSIVLLLAAMDQMQSSNLPSGYSEYMETLEQLMQGQQAMNQGMQSLLPIPLGNQPNQNGLMQNLMQQQQQLMQELQELLEKNGSSGSAQDGGELGRALEQMEEIIKDFQNNTINEETFNKGEKVYNKLLNHQKATKEKGMDELWKSKKFNEDELIKNNQNINLNNKQNLEIQELYETLNKLNKNKNIKKENKNIIEEYIKILINEKKDQKKNEE